jgi:lipid-A-disaccharide synthase
VTLVYVIAGEESGDVLGAKLMAALKAARPGLEFAGIGGPRMEAEGMVPLFAQRELAVMGLLEVLPKIVQLRARLRQTIADILARRPAVLVTIDSPGFTLRVLRGVADAGKAGHGIPRAHYVAPQVWAWREGRVKHFPGLWEKLLCLLPFEPAFFARHGLAADFVGHPVLEVGLDQGDAARFRAAHAILPEQRLVIVMPGSRRSEIARLLPIFGETLERLAARVPGLVPVVPVAHSVADAVRAATGEWRVRPILVSATDDKHDAFAAAAVALVKSGTSTLELALAGVPMVVGYRVNPITAMIARWLIKVKYVGLVNLLAGREAAPELIQGRCNPAELAAEVGRLLDDPAAAAAQRLAFRDIAAGLAPKGMAPSAAAAAAVLALADGRQT